uniref:Thiazole synthase n=1 Tax=Rhizochromulina marina TaxID=1034831 RepID=A0A514CQ08_9STRA|nr:thiazole phosphate synthase ThiG [Rhizochromulina marina]QDH81844.1 thiazole phosphate synthase ThiG [Rhizochromulina marina]
MTTDKLKIGNHEFTSRLIIGSGKYANLDDALASIEKSHTEMLTVAIRRLQITHDRTQEQNLFTKVDWSQITLLPNTAGARTAEDAIRMAFIAKEFTKRIGQDDNFFIKLEVIPDPKYLLPDPVGTLKAAKYLIKSGFTVLPYINADPILAMHLEDIGCATVMPLGSPIGSGQGLQNLHNIQIIKDTINIPVIVDAGIRAPSDVANALEIGVDAVLVNTAIARSKQPSAMAEALYYAALAGRKAYLAGSMEKSQNANASSPISGLFL